MAVLRDHDIRWFCKTVEGGKLTADNKEEMQKINSKLCRRQESRTLCLFLVEF